MKEKHSLEFINPLITTPLPLHPRHGETDVMQFIISRRALAREGDYEMMPVCACVRACVRVCVR